MNKVPIPNVRLKPADDDASSKKQVSYFDLFTNRRALIIVLSQAALWLSAGLSYYGLSFAADGFGGSMYTNFLLSAVVELPASYGSIFFVDRFGRKSTGSVAFALTCISCLAAGITAKSGPVVFNLMFGTFGKFVASMCFCVIYVWSAEIYPTVVRTQGMSINIAASRTGAAMSPFVVKSLKAIHPAVPFLFMACVSGIAVLLSLVLDETNKKPSRENFDDLFITSREYRELKIMSDVPDENRNGVSTVNGYGMNGHVEGTENGYVVTDDEIMERELETDTLLVENSLPVVIKR